MFPGLTTKEVQLTLTKKNESDNIELNRLKESVLPS